MWVYLERGIALDALQMALTERQPPQGLLHHSDRGSQYASREYQQLLATHGFGPNPFRLTVMGLVSSSV
jgi:putative transposase